jgi:hypothetical protein
MDNLQHLVAVLEPVSSILTSTFELWHLKKVDNKAELNMIEWDRKTWYWCNDHTHNNKGVVTQGMYIFHKPGSEHDAWRAKKNQFKKGGSKNSTVTTPKAPTPVLV